MKLDSEQETILLKAAPLVDDHARDEFFAHVAARLVLLREISVTDIRHACGSVIAALRDDDAKNEDDEQAELEEIRAARGAIIHDVAQRETRSAQSERSGQ
jgi:hypothetical protein